MVIAYWEGAKRRQVNGGGGGVISIIMWFRCNVITLNGHQRACWHNNYGQEAGMYGVLIGINNEPGITLLLSLHIVGHLTSHFSCFSVKLSL